MVWAHQRSRCHFFNGCFHTFSIQTLKGAPVQPFPSASCSSMVWALLQPSTIHLKHRVVTSAQHTGSQGCGGRRQQGLVSCPIRSCQTRLWPYRSIPLIRLAGHSARVLNIMLHSKMLLDPTLAGVQHVCDPKHACRASTFLPVVAINHVSTLKVHSAFKRPVGSRLARAALAQAYSVDSSGGTPRVAAVSEVKAAGTLVITLSGHGASFRTRICCSCPCCWNSRCCLLGFRTGHACAPMACFSVFNLLRMSPSIMSHHCRTGNAGGIALHNITGFEVLVRPPANHSALGQWISTVLFSLQQPTSPGNQPLDQRICTVHFLL
jgi:hypothetical protein